MSPLPVNTTNATNEYDATTFGYGDKTQASSSSALKRFDDWQRANGQPTIDALTEHDIAGDFLEDLLSRFAHHISETTLLSDSTACQYLSKAKERLHTRFPNHAWWNLDWYPKLRRKLATTVQRRDFSSYRDDSDDTQPFYIKAEPEFARQKRRDAVLDRGPKVNGSTYAIDGESLCDRLLRKCIGEPLLKHGPAQQRAWIVLTFYGVGRGGEIKFQQYTDWWWDVFSTTLTECGMNQKLFHGKQ
jgi:hypothetical protein